MRAATEKLLNSTWRYDMLNDKTRLVTPGDTLKTEFMSTNGMGTEQLAENTGILEDDLGEILAGKKAIDAEIARKLAAFFHNSASFWTNLQKEYDTRSQEES
jgi:addiction module HigA family antidote